MARPSAQSSAPETTVLRRDVDLTPSDWRGDTILLHGPGESGTRVISALERRAGTETFLSRPASTAGTRDFRRAGDGSLTCRTRAARPRSIFNPGQVAHRESGQPSRRPAPAVGPRRYAVLHSRQLRHARDTGRGPMPTVSTPQTVLVADGLRDFAVSQTAARFLVVGAAPGTQVPQAFMIFEWLTTVPPPPQAPPRL